ncbi:TOMM precursor leader peptide-binding protein [Amycolatopsis cihanbeyliensis]|uniref:Bacteriocin biosynthesis cyclodehydratase domain-containing protein n=1 Tax=Amycolatopsis cihanbeyliensis TaxID=1128664 RepID=A0A542DPK3_AMYCI|nr:TOMM precursor leader peptide-binding protein [Amycolatopsis cihanbeyliensis]TQJ04997.1 bacteriocin biosynthesis cyclodehydratase domain-containing protein [Amycolatopsis cihanbeyliensis]
MTEQLPDVTLPERPRLLPGLEVLERDAGEVQIGLDPRHAVVASGLPRPVIEILRGLDGSTSTRALLDLAADEDAEHLRALLTGLVERGLLEDAGSPDAELPEHCALVMYGGGRLAVAMATLLATAGVGHLDVRATGMVTGDELGSGYTAADVGRPSRLAILHAVRRANPKTRTTRLTRPQEPDLVLLTDAVVPAPEVVRELVADGLPHLPVRVREGTGIIGPLVYPGRSSCLRCADLHRTARDPSWPRLAGQLAGRTQHAELSTVQATAALATTQVLRALRHTGEPPPVWNAALEIDAYDGTVAHRSWLPHPECWCGAKPPRLVPPVR